MLCPSCGPRLGTRPRPRGRARPHRLACLLPGRSDRTGLSDRRIRPTGCGWRRRRGRNPRLLGRRSRRGSRAAIRPFGLPAESEPGQEALFGRRRLRWIPYRYDTMRRLRSGSPLGRRRRITRLGLCGSIRRLAAGLRLWSLLSRRRLDLPRLSRRRLHLLRPRRRGLPLPRLTRWGRTLFLLRRRCRGLFLLRRRRRRLFLRSLLTRLKFLADRRSARGSCARGRLRTGSGRRRLGRTARSRSRPSGRECTRSR